MTRGSAFLLDASGPAADTPEMLPADRLLRYLDHDDVHVSRYVAGYFKAAHTVDPATPEIVWQAMGKLRAAAASTLLPLLARMPLGDGDLRRLVDALSAPSFTSSRDRLLALLAELPADAASRVLADADLAAAIPPEVRERLRRRVAFAALPFDALWGELERRSALLEGLDPEDADRDTPQDLIAALQRFPTMVGPRAERIVSDSARYGSWIQLFSTQLVGLVRYAPAIPGLLDLVAEDGDYLNEAAVKALVRIGTPEVVREAAERFPNGNDDYRIYAPGILEGIKLPESEAAALELYRLADDLEDRTALAQVLVDLCTTSGFDDVYRMTLRGAYDSSMADFEELMVVLCVVQEREVPEFARWRANVQRHEEMVERRMAGFARRVQPSPATAPTKRGWRSTSKKKSRGKKAGRKG